MNNFRGLIAAVTRDFVIGIGGTIPWHHPGDFRRFKRLTLGSTIIMGRLTWTSIGARPLKGRKNLVITAKSLPEANCFRSIPEALRSATGPIWFVGGARVYAEGMNYSDLIDLTFVPEHIDHPQAVRFPPIDPAVWVADDLVDHEDEPGLRRRTYYRSKDAPRAEC